MLTGLEKRLNPQKAVDTIYFFSVNDDMQEIRYARDLRKSEKKGNKSEKVEFGRVFTENSNLLKKYRSCIALKPSTPTGT